MASRTSEAREHLLPIRDTTPMARTAPTSELFNRKVTNAEWCTSLRKYCSAVILRAVSPPSFDTFDCES